MFYKKKMSDNSSCSSDSNTFQMYQDFDILFGDPIPRRDQCKHSWIDWDAHVEKLCHEQCFNREYRMSLQAFNKLVFILSSLLKRNDAYLFQQSVDGDIVGMASCLCSLQKVGDFHFCF